MSDEKEATLRDVVNGLESARASIAEVAKWLRFQSVPRLREILLRELDVPNKKTAYELTDGEHSRRDIAKEIGIADETVRNWWERWQELAIVRESENWRGRPQRIVSLGELGIEVPRPRPKQPPLQETAVPGPLPDPHL